MPSDSPTSPPPPVGRARTLGRLIGGPLAAVALLASLAGCSDDDGDAATDEPPASTSECAPAEKPAEPVLEFDDAPPDCLEEGVDYAATLTTNLGEVTIDLLEDEAPGTVNNFVTLARYGYYDGSSFHRVIPGFVAQGGDPTGEPPGSGDPGYTIPDELPEAGSYEIGSVAMANRFDARSGEGRDSAGSQFFIVTGEGGVSLPPDYALFGTVSAGADVVEQISALGSQSGATTEPVTVTAVDIIEQ